MSVLLILYLVGVVLFGITGVLVAMLLMGVPNNLFAALFLALLVFVIAGVCWPLTVPLLGGLALWQFFQRS